ncbi:hypothetical protein [Sideroxydans sp. CL21]|uniref:hypothetical protein n=1 Tax=Sideroxydans sp. CL21 TaxID=2600596 RepID=UPI0024BC2538|nr:hypothetical protein [Sideroxydans sp. CL21]
MGKFRLMAFAAATLFAVSVAAEQPKIPASAVVAQMYKDFKWETEPGVTGKVTLFDSPPEVLSKYFDKTLVDLVTKRRNCNYQMCGLDYSPMWNSQDPDGVSVTIKSTARADVVTVDVIYFNGTSRLTYYLRETPAGWRIKDMKSPYGSLVTLLDVPEPTTIVDSLFDASYDQGSVHFEMIKTQTFLPSCQKFFSDINPLPEDLTLYSSYTRGSTAIYIAGIGDNIKLVVLRNGDCDTTNFPIHSVNQKVNSYTHEPVKPILTDEEVTGVFEDYLVRHAKAFGGKDAFFKWLDEETNRIAISCKGQSEWICPVTYHGLQPKLQKTLGDFRKN